MYIIFDTLNIQSGLTLHDTRDVGITSLLSNSQNANQIYYKTVINPLKLIRKNLNDEEGDLTNSHH